MRTPRPTARTQLTTVALTGSFFASNDKADCLKEEIVARQETNGKTTNNVPSSECSTTTAANVNKSRPPLFSRNQQGYQLVKTKEDETPHLTPWLTKSSTYSLLSNVSTDSFLSEMEGDDRAQSQMVKLENVCPSLRRPGQPRSESVHNFTSSSTRSSIPRSMTTVRFNPFDPNKDATDVKRDETFDFTTSDYASEADEPFAHTSFVGISNPVYTEFSSSVAEGEDLLAGEHRNFAQALNPSLLNKSSLTRASRLRNEVLSQLLRLNMMNDRTLRTSPNVVTPMNSLDDSNDDGKQGSQPTSQDEEWSILMLGGREPIPLTIFDRPLSIWMYKL